ncbi:MAG TPA: ferritin-like domain-containing protein [Steroidobacteraceae bacterium]|jgi:bacterioferritin|nr:ferritin-like domain-containing protein [Steroidobacteraceae bacterium]
MESKQTPKKSKANVILAKTRMSAKLQGEGDYEAARRYDIGVRKFVQHADVGRAARAAAPRNKREAQEMAAAEAIGRQGEPGQKSEWFLADLEGIRQRARAQLAAGAITDNYQGDVQQAVTLLNHAVATEIVCVLRYKYHAVVATGISSEAVKEEFTQHAKEEEEHLDMLCERINQLGGNPNMNPEGLLSRAASQYVEGKNLVDMIKENLVAERVAIETYRDMVRYFGDKDPTTRTMLERILAQEEEHANDMHDLLVQHQGRRIAKKK